MSTNSPTTTTTSSTRNSTLSSNSKGSSLNFSNLNLGDKETLFKYFNDGAEVGLSAYTLVNGRPTSTKAVLGEVNAGLQATKTVTGYISPESLFQNKLAQTTAGIGMGLGAIQLVNGKSWDDN